MEVYIVLARRFGNSETHAYVVGAFDNIDLANKHADSEESYRGGKYSCEIVKCELNTEDSSIVRNSESTVGDVKSLWPTYLEFCFKKKLMKTNKNPAIKTG